MTNKNIFGFISILIIVLISMCSYESNGEGNDSPDHTIKDNTNPERIETLPDESKVLSPEKPYEKDKHIIAIVQSGDYYNYRNNFAGILERLVKLGWLNPVEPIRATEDRPIPQTINMLQSHQYSNYLTFEPDLFFDFNWNDSEMMIREARFQRIIKLEDIDLIISFGTIAGRILSGVKKNSYDKPYLPADFDTPVILAGVSNPIEAGIIPSENDSGKDYLTTVVDKERFVRQVELFHKLVGFDKLGVVYADTEIGRVYSAINDIRKVAREKGFEIVSSTEGVAQENNEVNAKYRYLEALKDIAPHINAVYLVIAGGLELKNIDEIMEVVNNHNLTSFAMEGSEYVKHGVLFSMSTIQGKQVGAFHAEKMVKILKGEMPGNLEQKFSPTPSIAINLETANMINFEVPIELLRLAEEVYYEIHSYERK
jgi:ABC-type uncharacterized transport system substrate-binding protein